MTVRKSFTEEFKREAIRLAQERGNLSATARDLGISDNTLHSWKKQLQQTSAHPFPRLTFDDADTKFVVAQGCLMAKSY